MVFGANQPLAQALAFGPILGFQRLGQIAVDPGTALTQGAIHQAAEFMNGFSFYVAPDVASAVGEGIASLRSTTSVSEGTRAKLAAISQEMTSLGIPEEKYFDSYRGTFGSSGSGLLDRLLSIGSATPPYIRQMRRKMLAMGIDPHKGAVDEVRGDIQSYYGNTTFKLIDDLNARSPDANVYGEILIREAVRTFDFKNIETAKAGLGIDSDNRTVSIRIDEKTGMVMVSYVAGYHDAKPFGAYGLPFGTATGVPMPLPSGRGFAVLARLENEETSYETRLYHILPNDPAIDYDKLHRHLVRINEENLRNGKADDILQRIRRTAYSGDKDLSYWKTFYWAFHQYMVERGIIDLEALRGGQLQAEGFFFAPDIMEAGALTVFGCKNGPWTPLDGLSKSVQGQRPWIESQLTYERPFRTEDVTFYPHLFAATIRPRGK